MSASPYALRPSAAPRWVECPGSVRMEAQYPSEETEDSREGTAAHEVGAALITGARPVSESDPYTQEMWEAAQLYAEVAEEVKGERRIEEPFPCPSIHPQCGGTPDLSAWDAATRRLTILDFKYGHRFVDAWENWQLITYASGALDALGIDGHADQQVDVLFGIVQPRNYDPSGPIRWWRVKASDLRGYINRLRAAAEAAMEPEAECRAGPHCRDCSARAHCPANQAASMAWLDESRRAIPHELPPEVLGLELDLVRRAIEELQAREAGLEAVGLGMIRNGKNVPGFRGEQGQGREWWNKPDFEVLTLGGLYGVEVSKPGLITPKQAIKAGLPAEVVRAYTETPPGALKLVSTKAEFRRIFSN